MYNQPQEAMIQKPVALYAASFLFFTGLFAFGGQPSPTTTPTSISLAEVMENEVVIAHLTPFEEALLRPRRLKPLPPEKISTETLWLARAIFSETKRPEEQMLVAWVIRNRVETRFRGRNTYHAVVLDPYQFSAFLPDNLKRPYYSGLGGHSDVPGWQTALRIADSVRLSNASERPFSIDTRHFYSERSMAKGGGPKWADGRAPVALKPALRVDELRFRFFAGIV
jgi:hypothetical protein